MVIKMEIFINIAFLVSEGGLHIMLVMCSLLLSL